jgi:hypothetical protein
VEKITIECAAREHYQADYGKTPPIFGPTPTLPTLLSLENRKPPEIPVVEIIASYVLQL